MVSEWRICPFIANHTEKTSPGVFPFDNTPLHSLYSQYRVPTSSSMRFRRGTHTAIHIIGKWEQERYFPWGFPKLNALLVSDTLLFIDQDFIGKGRDTITLK